MSFLSNFAYSAVMAHLLLSPPIAIKHFRVWSQENIVIRNGKIVWKVIWIKYYLRLILSSRRYQCLGYLSIHLGVNYVIYGCSSARATPGASIYRSLTLEGNIVGVVTQDRVIDDNLKRHIKNQTSCTLDYCDYYIRLFIRLLCVDYLY